ncbi:RNA polymerase sigma factor SigM [Micromonospora sp. NPDC005087]|uniref:RNA polymerase sigma factor SigM n=1 Tax=Micromonospora sp. NPDC005087 TaxID=3364225 RepID=UPI0036B7D57F
MDGRDAATDLELLRAHASGDRDAFAELFHRHRDRLWAVALRTLGDREEAADALQDALLSAHRAAARFRGDSAVTTWLHRIVVNACLDRIRRRQAHPTVPLPDGNRAGDGSGTPGVEPAAPAQDHDTALVVREALAALPVEQRAALVLVDLQGYPVAEVARILGVAEGTVKSRCARGRTRLAVLLGHLRPSAGTATPVARPQPSGPVAGVPGVTPGNPRPAEGVGSGSGRYRRDANQEDT